MTNEEYQLAYDQCVMGSTMGVLREMSDVKRDDFLNKLYLDEDKCIHVRLAIIFKATKLIG